MKAAEQRIPTTAPPRSDRALVEQALGDPASRALCLEALLARHRGRLRARARRLLGSESDADDALQELFLRAHAALPSYRPERPVVAWLDVVLRNSCLQTLRQRRRRDRLEAALPPVREADTPEIPADPLLALRLDRGLAELPEGLRRVLLLRGAEGLGYDEIGRRLGITPGAARMRALRARRWLRAPAPQARRAAAPSRAAGPCETPPLEAKSRAGGEARALRVLYIDDDAVARTYVARGLAKHGFEVDEAPDLEQGLARARSSAYEVLILDVELPDGEGFDLLKRLRAGGVDTPALFLSARGAVEDRLRGFEEGGDDYLPKPFALSELAARLRAVARRRLAALPDQTLRVADLVLDLRARRVERAGQEIELPPKPLALLELLMSRAGRVVSRDEMVEAVWGPDAEVRANALEVQINALRRRVDRPFGSALIHTRPGLGYVLEARS